MKLMLVVNLYVASAHYQTMNNLPIGRFAERKPHAAPLTLDNEFTGMNATV